MGVYAMFRSIGDETYCKEIFEEYITQLKEEAKESERKRKEERVWMILIPISIIYYYYYCCSDFFMSLYKSNKIFIIWSKNSSYHRKKTKVQISWESPFCLLPADCCLVSVIATISSHE